MTLIDWLIGIGVAAAFVLALLWLTEIEARKLARANKEMQRHVSDSVLRRQQTREDQGD